MGEDWTPSSILPPPQGAKVVCFHKGDVWIGYRFGKLWIQLPYCQGLAIKTEVPQMWKFPGLPEGFTGYMLFGNPDDEKELLTFDEFEKRWPSDAKEFVRGIKSSLQK